VKQVFKHRDLINVAVDKGIAIAGIYRVPRYGRKRSLYIAMCHICSSTIALAGNAEVAREALEAHLQKHSIDQSFTVKITVTRGKRVETAIYQYMHTMHTLTLESKAYAEGLREAHEKALSECISLKSEK
jgi:hypothetical protein